MRSRRFRRLSGPLKDLLRYDLSLRGVSMACEPEGNWLDLGNCEMFSTVEETKLTVTTDNLLRLLGCFRIRCQLIRGERALLASRALQP
jgi:hypothetical protein